MRVKYQKRRQLFGEYQASHVIWINTLKDEVLIKFNILDQTGNLLYKIMEPPESDNYELTQADISVEQINEIQQLLMKNDPDFDWQYDADVALILGSFGESLARRHWLIRDSKKESDVIVDYIFESDAEHATEEIFQTDYFEKGITEDEVIEQYLLPKMIERKDVDTVQVNIAEAGVVNSYRVTIQECD